MKPGLDRQSLKLCFKAGNRPTEADFEKLIEGSLNLKDDGFERSDENGLRVHAHEGYNGLFTFYRNAGSEEALWSLGFSGPNNLAMRPGDATSAPLVSFDRRGGVALGHAQPRCTLDVKGNLSVGGRLGQPPEPALQDEQAQRAQQEDPVLLVADGQWKDLTGPLQGCQGFEVMAGTGRLKDRSRIALLHAFAFNVYHPAWWQNLLGSKRRIRCQHAFYERRRHRLELRWFSPDGSHGENARYHLQIRSGSDYMGHERKGGKLNAGKEEVPIHVYLTRLWFQPHMEPLKMNDWPEAPR